MKILKYFSISIMFSLLFSACETSQTPVDHLSALLQRIDNESDGYTEEDLLIFPLMMNGIYSLKKPLHMIQKNTHQSER